MITPASREMSRAVITGIGVIAPNGVGKTAFWEATKAGRSGLKTIQRFDASRYLSRIAGEVVDFQPEAYLDRRVLAQSDRSTYMAIVATELALKDANVDTKSLPPERMGVIMASSSGGNEFAQREMQNLWSKGPIFVSAYQSIAWFPAARLGQISIRYGIKGLCRVVVAEQSGGLEAIAQASRAIRRNMHLVVSGGTDASIAPFAHACQQASGFLSLETNPNNAYLPFDARAAGHVPGEGGAVLIVEDLASARERSAPNIYGEIVSCGISSDAQVHLGNATEGRQLVRAIRLALEGADVSASDVDCIFADGAADASRDLIEADAINTIFEGRDGSPVPVTVPKTMTGRLYGGGGALDVASALLALRDQRIPPTINIRRQSRNCDLNLVKDKSIEAKLNHVLVIARGFGGFNAALVLRRVEP